MKVDVHAHCYPQFYIDELARIGIDKGGGVGVPIPLWGGAQQRIAEMDGFGVDMEVLALSAPNVYFQDRVLSRSLAERTNDFIANVAEESPKRFLSLASIPLTDLDDALEELARALDTLKMDGIVLGTNVNNVPLSDDRFLPFFEEVNRRKTPVVLHPQKSLVEKLMPEEDEGLGIPSSVGFLFETTRTMAQMTFKGTFERLPDLTFVLPHSGGAIPFLCPRWDIFYRSRPKGHRLKQLSYPPSHYLKRHYYDTALSYAHSSLRCTLDFAGADHVVLGTDHPYTNDFRGKETVESIEMFDLSSEEKEKIFSGNAARLFPKLRARVV